MNAMGHLKFNLGSLKLTLALCRDRSQCDSLTCCLNKDFTLDWGLREPTSGNCQHFVLSPSAFHNPPDSSACAWIPVEKAHLSEGLRKTLDFVSRLICAHPSGSTALSIIGLDHTPHDLLAKETLQYLFKLVHGSASSYIERSIAINLHEPQTFRSFADLAILLYEQWCFNLADPALHDARSYRNLASFDRSLP